MKERAMKIYQSRHLIPVLTALAVISLLLSTYAVVQYTRSQTERERERISSDLASCERGNVVRAQIREVGYSTRDLIDGILDKADESRDYDATWRADLVPLFVKFEQNVAAIAPVDCQVLTPGA